MIVIQGLSEKFSFKFSEWWSRISSIQILMTCCKACWDHSGYNQNPPKIGANLFEELSKSEWPCLYRPNAEKFLFLVRLKVCISWYLKKLDIFIRHHGTESSKLWKWSLLLTWARIDSFNISKVCICRVLKIAFNQDLLDLLVSPRIHHAFISF